MFFSKYYKNPSRLLNWALVIILLIFWVDVYFYSVLNGLNYIYQIVIG